MKLGY